MLMIYAELQEEITYVIDIEGSNSIDLGKD